MSNPNIQVKVNGPQALSDALRNYGTIILKPNVQDNRNVLTQEMMSKANTKYVIQWNYDLMGQTINVPVGCMIEFNGGTVTNGTIVGNNTILLYDKNIDEIFTANREGTFIYNTTVADEEDITSETGQLKFKDKTYNSDAYSGLAKKILRKNMVNGINTLTQAMVSAANTIYVIQYDFTLGEDITIPANCVLKFEGGSIDGNHILTGSSTKINGNLKYIFGRYIDFGGTWNVPEIRTEMFTDLNYDNSLSKLIKLTSDNIYNKVEISNHGYDFYFAHRGKNDKLLVLKENTHLIVNGTIRMRDNSDPSNYYGPLIALNKHVTIEGSGKLIGSYSQEETYESSYFGQRESFSAIMGWLSVNETNPVPGDIIIRGIYIQDFFGDGITVRNCNKLIIENIEINHSGRSDIAIVNTRTSSIINCNLLNARAVGIDFEPNEGESYIDSTNIIIENCYIDSCTDAFQATGRNSSNANGVIRYSNNVITNCLRTFQIGNADCIEFSNNYIYSPDPVYYKIFGCLNILLRHNIFDCNLLSDNTKRNYKLTYDNNEFRGVLSLGSEDYGYTEFINNTVAKLDSIKSGKIKFVNNTIKNSGLISAGLIDSTFSDNIIHGFSAFKGKNTFVRNNKFIIDDNFDISELGSNDLANVVRLGDTSSGTDSGGNKYAQFESSVFEGNLIVLGVDESVGTEEAKAKAIADNAARMPTNRVIFSRLIDSVVKDNTIIVFGSTSLPNYAISIFNEREDTKVTSLWANNKIIYNNGGIGFGTREIYGDGRSALPYVPPFIWNLSPLPSGLKDSYQGYNNGFNMTSDNQIRDSKDITAYSRATLEKLPSKGDTASRPSLNNYAGYVGFEYFDTDLGKPIYWLVNSTYTNGTWVDATGATV